MDKTMKESLLEELLSSYIWQSKRVNVQARNRQMT
jgi:hypothetical protein